MKAKKEIKPDIEDDKSRFVWKRPVSGSGYSWIDFQFMKGGFFAKTWPGVQRFLMASPDCQFVQYFPLEDNSESGLFRKFAFLEPTLECFLEFVNQQGRLGTRYHDMTEIDGEMFGDWIHANRVMHRLVTMWDMVQKQDEKGLSKFITWDGDKASVDFRGLINPNNIWKKLKPEKLEMHRTHQIAAIVQPCAKGDLIMPAIFFIRHMLNSEMRDTKASIPRMFWSPTESTLKLRYVPHNLLGAMYLQFAMALNVKSEFRECAVCRKPFRLSPGVNRANRLTCSETCKTYRYRGRIEKARELHGQGKTVREIVKELSVGQPGWNLKKKIETVKSWIAKGQQ